MRIWVMSINLLALTLNAYVYGKWGGMTNLIVGIGNLTICGVYTWIYLGDGEDS